MSSNDPQRVPATFASPISYVAAPVARIACCCTGSLRAGVGLERAGALAGCEGLGRVGLNRVARAMLLWLAAPEGVAAQGPPGAAAVGGSRFWGSGKMHARKIK